MLFSSLGINKTVLVLSIRLSSCLQPFVKLGLAVYLSVLIVDMSHLPLNIFCFMHWILNKMKLHCLYIIPCLYVIWTDLRLKQSPQICLGPC